MKIRTNNVTPNIDNVVVNQDDGQYNISTTIKFLARNLATAKKDYFIVLCLNEEVANSLIGDRAELASYISRRKTTDNVVVVHDRFSYDPRRAPMYTSPYEKVTLTKEITINQQNISNLTIIVTTARQLRMRKITTYSPLNKDMIRVFRNGSVPTENIVLYEDEAQEKIWIGDFFRDTQGDYRKLDNSQLFVKTVPNTKIIFHSLLVKQLYKTIVNDFNSLFSFNKGLNTTEAIVDRLSTESTNYFSDLYFAKTTNLRLPLSFSFNKLAFFKNNTLFGRLIKNQAQLLSSVELLDVRFIRKRVKSYNPSSPLTAFGPTVSYKNTEQPLGTSVTLIDILNNNGIITVQGTDTDMDHITYGLYQYGVEMVFMDHTAEKIRDIISADSDGLELAASNIKTILAEASLPNNYDVYSQEFLAAYKTKYNLDHKPIVVEAIKKYVSALAVFYENFSLSLQESPNSLALKIYDLANPMTRGPSALQELLSLINGLISELLLFIKKSALAPGSAQNQQTKTSQLGNDARIIKKKHFFKQVVDADMLVNDGYDYLSTQIGQSLNPTYSNFRLLSYNEFDQLKTAEITKFEGLDFAQKDDIALTPNYFKLNKHTTKINLVEPETEGNDSVIGTQILVAKAYRNSPINFGVSQIKNNNTGLPNKQIQTIKNSVMIAAQNSCQIEVNVAPRTDIFDTPEILLDADNYLDAAEKLSEQSPFVINKTGSVSLNQFLFSIINNNTEERYLDTLQNLSNDMLSYLIQTDYFSLEKQDPDKRVKNITDKEVFYSKNNTFDAFNQQVLDQEKDKAVRTTAMNAVFDTHRQMEFYPPQELRYGALLRNPVSASQVANIAMKYGNTRKIEYLAGFKQSEHTLFMGEPVWAPLTEGVYENFFASQRTLMCRLKEYSSLFSKYEGVRFPIYDEIFLIGSAPTPAPASTPPTMQSFASLDVDTENLDEMQYACGEVENVQYTVGSVPMISRDLPQNQHTGLYTNGNDFLLPNGDKYVGLYHIHYDAPRKKFIAMAGVAHTSKPHDNLTPVSNKAHRVLREAMQSREGDLQLGGGNY
tara:strand:+ start:3179 stop:6337 length:3159 start_codon:yes stop_codon:yes gene_type:complete